MHTESHHLQHKLRLAEHRLHPIVIVNQPQVTYDFSSQIMSYISNIMSMILLDNLLQYLLFIVVIDLSRTYFSIAILI
jgi:hypothetical protein